MENINNNTPIIREYLNLRTIEVHCADCLIPITKFKHVKRIDGTRHLWRVKEYYITWNNSFRFNHNGEIFCCCGQYLGYKFSDLEWALLKEQTKILY